MRYSVQYQDVVRSGVPLQEASHNNHILEEDCTKDSAEDYHCSWRHFKGANPAHQERKPAVRGA